MTTAPVLREPATPAEESQARVALLRAAIEHLRATHRHLFSFPFPLSPERASAIRWDRMLGAAIHELGLADRSGRDDLRRKALDRSVLLALTAVCWRYDGHTGPN